MPRFLPLLCLAAATLTPAAHADTLLDFTFYLGGYVDPGTPVADLPPSELGIDQTLRFTLPASPSVPPVNLCTGEFCMYGDFGFTVYRVPLVFQNYDPYSYPLVPIGPPVYTTGDVSFGYGDTTITGDNGFYFNAHGEPDYTLSPALEPTLTLENPDGYVRDFYARGSPVAFTSIIPEAAGTSPVPEPATLTLLVTGALGLVATRRRTPVA